MRSARTLRRVAGLSALLVICVACGATTTTQATRKVAARAAERARPVQATPRASQPVDPSAFTPGACVAFSPTGPARNITVFLDAGHGGRDPGAVGVTRSGRTIYEADLTLPVELDTMAVLRAAGFRVVVSRTHDSSVLRLAQDDFSGGVLTVDGSHEDVLARAACANDARADVLVGIYFDAGAPSNAGCLTAYDAVRPFAAESLRLAKILQADVLGAMNAYGWGIPSEGVLPDAGLGSTISSTAHAYGHLSLIGPAYPGWVTTPSRMPGALIEPLFITDSFEGSIAASRRGQKVIAQALARAVGQYFASRRVGPVTPAAAPAHRVIRGQIPERLPTTRRVVALTFDAGADNAGAPKITAALARARATATFFMTGRWAQLYPQWAKRIAARYPIGNHTFDHQDVLGLTLPAVRAEVLRARAAIQQATGRRPIALFRFPYGSSSATTLALVNQLGYTAVGWTVDTLGWEGTSMGQSVGSVTSRALDHLQPGEIILMHVGANPTDHSTLDADALPGIISAIRARGYRFVTLNEYL
jgi:peptidoglycan/xylan/chitin deacetylase (PgdA/CDA1 family)